MDGNLGIALMVALLASPFVLYLLVRGWFGARKRRREEAERAAANQAEAAAYFERAAAAQGVEEVETNLILGADEHAVLTDPAALYETQTYRLYGGAGTRVRGLHLGAGASEQHTRLRRIDAGTLVLTTKRLVFDGTTENRSVKLADILSADPLLDAIEVSTQKRGKSMLLSVPNPLIWAPMIKAVASKGRGHRPHPDELDSAPGGDTISRE
jgi:hypothetical protein